MINNILTVGDSFTYGEELVSRTNAYPQQLANRLNAQAVNLARPGSGNTRMIRGVVEHVLSNNPVDLVIVGWASPGRMEFADLYGVFDLWPGYGGNIFRGQECEWRLELLDYINKYHDPEYLYKTYLLNIIMLQSFLKERNIKYIMLATVANEYYHRTYFTDQEPLVNSIDTTYFFGWPTHGMAEWTQGCNRGPNGHFLEDGHQQVADKIYEHIRNLGWVS